MGTVHLITEAARFGTLLSEAVQWCERITLCISAPRSERGTVEAWSVLLAAHSKYDRVIVHDVEATEGWLLHRLHETSTLRLIEASSRRFDDQLLCFEHGGSVQLFLARAPLTRAAFRIDGSAVVHFQGESTEELALSFQSLMVGDGHQRIYGRVASLSRAGINVRGGRTRRLKLNYRTTQRIRGWAVALLSGMHVDDLDEGEDTLKGYYSLRQGSEPTFAHWGTEGEEADFVVQQLRAWIDAGKDDPAFSLSSLCLVARHRRQLETRYKPLLEQAGIAARLVTKDENRLGEGVRLATMHRVKGLEFPKVMIVGVQDGEVPTPRKRLSDDVSRLQHEESERRLLFVAATRARDDLVVTGFGGECRFLSRGEEVAACARAEETWRRTTASATPRTRHSSC